MNIKILLSKIISVVFLIGIWESLFGQGIEHETFELGSIPKFVMFAFAIGGVVMGYIQLRMSLKLAALDAKFMKEMTMIKDSFSGILKMEIEKMELKLKLASNEIENKMATSKDIEHIERIQTLQNNIILDKIKGLESQLEKAASVYKQDNKSNV